MFVLFRSYESSRNAILFVISYRNFDIACIPKFFIFLLYNTARIKPLKLASFNPSNFDHLCAWVGLGGKQ